LAGFADAALGAALRFALADAARAGKWIGGPEATGFFLLATGKHGAGELNYSSDIDVIALFEPGAPGLADGVEPSTFWVRIVRTLVSLMQERTADGYVFRTDLRLRPDPGATAVALSAPAALLYYESMGQNWERAALIKARPCAGDVAAGQAFLSRTRPVHLAQIPRLRSHRRRAFDQATGPCASRPFRRAGARHDIKRGRGGIREIEFFVQRSNSLPRGRDRSLRGRETRAMLARLREKGWIDEPRGRSWTKPMFSCATSSIASRCCATSRRTRCRAIRASWRGCAAHGLCRKRRVRNRPARRLERVAKRYSELFEEAPDLSGGSGNLVFTGGEDDPATLDTLRRLGFQEPATVTETVRGWHFGRFAAMRSTAARERLTEITPALLQAFSKAGQPDSGLRAFDSLLRALPAGAQLFALLSSNRQLLDLLATILGAAPRLAEMFARRPHVVDALIEPASSGEAYTAEALEAQLGARLAEAASLEDVLNRVRLFAAEHRFLISVRLLRGFLNAPEAGMAFSDLAEAVLRHLFRHTLTEFERQHGRLAGGRAAILAFGRLGSREMTAGSDLDLIVIYDHAADAPASDGARPLSPSQYYTRLTQRLVAAVSAPTGEGIAYSVDLRLRPSGRAGPLATHIASFEHYQRSEAWIWEHMAMSRGRPVAGDSGLMDEVSTILDAVVAMPREPRKLGAEIADMRGRIEREKVAAGPFDVKLAAGGLIDCEFAAQYLVLVGLGRIAGETTAQTLRRGFAAGALPSEDGELFAASRALQSALLHILRSVGEGVDADRAPEALKRILVEAAAASIVTCPELPIDSFAGLRSALEKLQPATRAALERLLQAPISAGA
jgi:glutamate-ammonia-ligase adenylyltransferase